jgi:hypothetical protein
MIIKDLIAKLEELREKEMHYFDVMGEPSIELDVFKCVDEEEKLYQYAGLHTGEIIFDRSSDGVYNIITSFAEVYNKEKNELTN